MEQAAVIAFLSNPHSYGANVVSVERHETHGAIVFLAGDNAYKLKRAVKYPYMDYSTLALRRAKCEAELAVNRRTAPGLYLEVRPIVRGQSGRLRFGTMAESANAIDWVVVMKRFPQSALLEEMRKRGKLTHTLMRQLADVIAEFHSRAEIYQDFGGGSGIAHVIDENTTMLRHLEGRPFKSAAIDQYRARSLESLRQVVALLERRRQDGFVRRCHGDLHLNNICLIDGKPMLFDAVEFNKQFSCIDVLYDLAFLIMDLEHRKLRSLANALLNRYLECTRDYEGLAALPLFLSCRAGVRAHVAATLAEATGTNVSLLTADARDLLHDAIAFLDDARPSLVAVGGLSGSGKSTIGRGLAPHIGRVPGAVMLRSDVIRKRLCGISETVRLPGSAYTPSVSGRVYDSIAESSKKVLASGYSVIVDAVYGMAAQRTQIESIAYEMGARFCGLWLDAPVPVLEARLAQRTQDASDATIDVLHRQCCTVDVPKHWVRVDAGRTPEFSLARALNALAATSIPSVTTSS